MVKFMGCMFCHNKTVGGNHTIASVFLLDRSPRGSPQEGCEDTQGTLWTNLGGEEPRLPANSSASTCQPCEGAILEVSLWAFRPGSWPAPSRQPHQRVPSRATQRSHSQTPEPRKPCEIINIYGCLEPLSIGIIRYFSNRKLT